MRDVIFFICNNIIVCLFVIMNFLDFRNFEYGKFYLLIGLNIKRNKLIYFKILSFV